MENPIPAELEKEIKEMDELFEQGWFNKWLEGMVKYYPEIADLPPEKQIEKARIESVHGFTCFFRDNLTPGILEHMILPEYSRPIKISFVGCSDGREVYSFLIQNWKKRNQLVVSAFDINPELLEEGRTGGAGIPRTSKGYRVHSAYSEQYYKLDEWKKFGAEGEAYTFCPRGVIDHSWADLTFTEEATKKINFGVHDITKNPLPEKYDVIVMHNVLCHYSQKGREIILKNIKESLNEKGWLVCETNDPGSENSKKEYREFMDDILRYGFEKQKTIIPTWFKKEDDVSHSSRVYKKI